ncbi:unnamed protein product [Anisakis simplex]|uniref:F-box domain-containing protein n=1 Tax=Anisakis simplex TaxID=6269 RepID=A0A0M3KFQ6_ANISI|nr:unnamed protein product [Anisakis simplex]
MKPTFGLDENVVAKEKAAENEYCEHLPNSVLRNIFKHLSYQDISKCHLICKHIHKFLCDHVNDFERPHLDDLIIESVREPGWVRQLRLEFKCLELFGTHACLKKTEFMGTEDDSFDSISKLTPSFMELINDKCRAVIASGDVTFRHIVLDDFALKQLLPILEPT